MEGLGLLDSNGVFIQSATIDLMSTNYRRSAMVGIVRECEAAITGNKHENPIKLYICSHEKLPKLNRKSFALNE